MLPFCLKWKPLGPTESLRSHFEEKSPRLAPVLAWEWARGRPLPGTRLATEPALPQPLGHRSADKAAFSIQTWPSLGPTSHSGLSFGISFSKCPQTQTLVAVCFSPHHELPADPPLVSRPCRPINNLLEPCTGSEGRAPLLFALRHRCLLLNLLSACLCLDSMGCPWDPRCFKCKDGFIWQPA